MDKRSGFYFGLALVTLVTLALEVVNARLFSVISWYHLAFFAISIAMLGMTAGAIYVYLRPGTFTSERGPAELAFYSWLFAFSVPVCHLLILHFQPRGEISLRSIPAFLELLLMTATAALPFFFSGVVVAVSLTRIGLPIGRVYFFDLLGAGLGCWAAILLMQWMDPSSGSFVLGAMAGLGALGFTRFAGRRFDRATGTIMVLVVAAMAWFGLWNASTYPNNIRLTHSKGWVVPDGLAYDGWNTHSRLTVWNAERGAPKYWGAGFLAPFKHTESATMCIDGSAETWIHEFDGEDVAKIEWIKHDISSLAYHSNGHGSVAVIGVGGGRDVLTALAFGCDRVVGIEVNGLILDLLLGRFREFCRIADRPDVTLIHDDGRSYLARSDERFDLIQMALIDTWASTTAGAMTLSENGLYTVQAWQTFFRRLKPQGVLTVSRWFSATDLGETARLISLAVAALLAEGAASPADHIVLASAKYRPGTPLAVSTLIVSPTPLTPNALATIKQAVDKLGFRLHLAPGEPISDDRLARIVGATSERELASIADPLLDLSPPTDERPFFFNTIRPSAWFGSGQSSEQSEGVLRGNFLANDNLKAILVAVTVLVGLSIILPLLAFGGRHELGAKRFALAAFYFSAIGLGFMLIEIGLMQRFSVLLGHPVWSLAVVLSSMILFAGVGSLASDRLRIDRRTRMLLLPVAIMGLTLAAVVGIQPVTDRVVGSSLPVRALATLAFIIPLALIQGAFFPIGMRLVEAHSSRATPWMWGINGAFGVLGSVLAVILSMCFGISWSLMLGGLCYLALLLPVATLGRPAAIADT